MGLDGLPEGLHPVLCHGLVDGPQGRGARPGVHHVKRPVRVLGRLGPLGRAHPDGEVRFPDLHLRQVDGPGALGPRRARLVVPQLGRPHARLLGPEHGPGGAGLRPPLGQDEPEESHPVRLVDLPLLLQPPPGRQRGVVHAPLARACLEDVDLLLDRADPLRPQAVVDGMELVHPRSCREAEHVAVVLEVRLRELGRRDLGVAQVDAPEALLVLLLLALVVRHEPVVPQPDEPVPPGRVELPPLRQVPLLEDRPGLLVPLILQLQRLLRLLLLDQLPRRLRVLGDPSRALLRGRIP
mmetsp:Transcript_30483/g.74234  ORF Transcript_30483/g.74234 Transcript_30483/m.74234 type:complete len:296 (-) Transcript_30483:495-1382(-)